MTHAHGFATIVADVKDTDGLLSDLKAALKPLGVVLQAWSIGSDDTIVTVNAGKRVRAREVKADLGVDDMPREEEL